jgi:hypothetical protein
MSDSYLAAACGLYCGQCDYLQNQCEGCGHVRGKPFWTVQMEILTCPLYDCCVNIKCLEHCGLCDEFPCALFLELRDPSLSDTEAEKALQRRKKDLLKRGKIGTENWLKEKGNNLPGNIL